MQLLLAEIRMEGDEMKQAAALYQPLVDAIKAEKPKDFDATTIAVFLGAVRAYCALGELEKAGEVGSVLIELGPDAPEVNAVLVKFARLLDLERKKAVAAVTNWRAPPRSCNATRPGRGCASIEKLLGKILTKLAGRREVSLDGMVFIGDGMNTVGMTDEASRQYQKILDRAETDRSSPRRPARP